MKYIYYFIFLLPITTLASAPELPDLNNWESLSEREKSEAGAFFLFYDLAKSKMIGPGTGVCMNYEPGDGGAGSSDKISIALDSAQFELAEASGMSLGKNADKIKNILGKIKTYLDNGCENGDCKSQRKVTVSGYADATRNKLPVDHQVEPIPPGTQVKYSSIGSRQSKAISKNASNPSVEESIKANTNLATRRASLYADLAKDFTDEVYVTANPSPIGEYLRDQKPLPANLDGQDLRPGDLEINCQSRRKAVIDVEFNPHKIDINSGPNTMGLNISAGSKNFLLLSSMDASLQILKHSISIGSRDEDKIIDSVLQAQGITDPEIVKGCKNEGTRLFIRGSLKRTNSKNLKQAVASNSDQTSVLAEFKDALKSRKPLSGTNADLKEIYDELRKEGIAAYAMDSRLMKNNGFSSSLIDCFSAKSALKAEMQKNTSLRSQLCKSAKDFTKDNTLKLSYNPSEPKHSAVHHIGCTGCGTGYNIAKNPATGKYEGYILDRYYGEDKYNRSTVMSDHRPLSRQEVIEYHHTAKSLVPEIIEMRNKLDKKAPDYRVKLQELNSLEFLFNNFNNGKSARRSFDYLDKHKSQFKAPEKLDSIKTFLDRVFHKSLPRDVRYVQTLLGNENLTDTEYYEKVLYPAITTQKKLSEWGAEEAKNTSGRMSFGGMKNPGYYVVPNCKCDDQTASVVDKIANLKPTFLNQFPYSADVNISDPDNTCVFMPPVPASCSYNPSESGLTTNNQNSGPAKIKWMSADGQIMEKTALEMAEYLGQENAKFGEVQECTATDPFEKAEQLLAQATCQGNMALPTTEKNDCSKANSSRQ